MSRVNPGPRFPKEPRALPATEVLIGRIGWLFRLRWVAIVGCVLFIEVARRLLPIRIYPRPIYAIVGILVVFNLIVGLQLLRTRRAAIKQGEATAPRGVPAIVERPVGSVARFLLPRTPPGVEYYDSQAAAAAVSAAVQITIDLILLALLLHFAGGIENPLTIFFVFHVIVASILLSGQATYAVATFGVLLLSTVALGELAGWLPHYSLGGHWGSAYYTVPGLVVAQLYLFAVTLYVAAYLASSIAARLRRREIDVVVLSLSLAQKAEHLEAAYNKLAATERTKSQYMRKVAHELRGPLGTVETALTVALPLLPDSMSQSARDLIQRAQRRARELAVVTRELLSLSRARGGQATAEMTRVDPEAVAREVLEEIEPKATRAHLRLTASIACGAPSMLADAEGLRDLLTNLLSNAVRYTPSGGTVSFSLRTQGDKLAIEVEDTGIGISAQDLPRIYEEFFRSKTAREFVPEGSGLGMAIAKAVVDQHQGTMSLESKVGEGTRVRVELPLSPP